MFGREHFRLTGKLHSIYGQFSLELTSFDFVFALKTKYNFEYMNFQRKTLDMFI